ncbi:hypothetical protein V3470_14570 [Flavobacterium oreochromis]|uniref:hypothetical protein n=1 Tax=Flavobacterium oreochromis TaxID=2906078 RepID=UPI000B4CB946|nr:hypothetical protein BWG23_14780 [Flavobacterium oreochromis]POR30737.1 hypothetical protein BWK58_00090 [Flavobacterium columnare]
MAKFLNFNFLITLIFILGVIKLHSQEKVNIWEASSKNRKYTIHIKEKTITINANGNYYKYKIYRSKKGNYFIMDNKRVCFKEDITHKKIFISYCNVKYNLEESINEIMVLEFKIKDSIR